MVDVDLEELKVMLDEPPLNDVHSLLISVRIPFEVDRWVFEVNEGWLEYGFSFGILFKLDIHVEYIPQPRGWWRWCCSYFFVYGLMEDRCLALGWIMTRSLRPVPSARTCCAQWTSGPWSPACWRRSPQTILIFTFHLCGDSTQSSRSCMKQYDVLFNYLNIFV